MWGGISTKGKTRLAFLEGKQDAKAYIGILQECLLTYFQSNMKKSCIFQQDNAPIHTSKCTKTWMEDNNVAILNWPARSPDLNLIENVWRLMVQNIYENGRSFKNKEDLKKEIVFTWENLLIEYSMPTRCIEVIKKSYSINY